MSEESKEIVVQDKFMMPVADVQTAMSRYQAFKDFVGGILKENTDFGSIPGSDKPALLKPGAEKLGAFFGLSPKFIPVEVVNDWTGKDHNGEPFFFYHYKCQLFRGDYFAGESFGSCNSWEKKYRYRWENEMNLPANTDLSKYECKDGTISEFAFAIDKAETTGKYGKPAEYWQKFKDAIDNGTARHFMRKTKKGDEMDAWEIGGKLYAIPNKDVADQVNTIDKMAQKRAFIAAILVVTNASEYFTQDLEDYTYEQTGEVIEGEVVESKPKKKRIKKFTDAQIGAVIQYEKEFENKDLEHNHVVNLLSLSEKIDDKTPENEIIMWVKKYRYEKDTNKADTSLAAEVADNEIFGG